MDIWHSRFADTTPLLAPLRAAAGLVGGSDWPELAHLQQLVTRAGICTASGLPLRLVPPGAGPDRAALAYEQRLYARGELECRERNWHDLFNVLVWITMPRAKAALNARHHAALMTSPADGKNRRGAVRDALTLFDESGVIVLSARAELLRMIRDFQWKPLFWEHRAAVVADMRFLLFGHALHEKALAPYKGMTGRGLLLEVDREILELTPAEQLQQVDARVAQWIADPQALRHPQDLAPLPVLGVPGWCGSNETADYYDDGDYFRRGRTRHVAPSRTGSGAAQKAIR